MDNLLPFLPRIAVFTPINKPLLVVAGIKDAKLKELKYKKDQQSILLNKKDDNNEKDIEENDSEKHLDIWA